MKYGLILCIPLCAAALFLFGCKAKPSPPMQPEVIEAGDPLDILSFSFSHGGSSTDQCFSLSAEQTEAGTRLYAEGLYSGGPIVDEVIEDPLLEQLGKIAGQYRLDLWDGFNESDSMVMDGSNFSLSMTLADGTSVYAHGSNAFPSGYGDAEREILQAFTPLIARYDPEFF